MTRSECLIGLAVAFFAQRAQLRLITAESCTGGLAASWVTQRAGSSAWFEGGVVSYSNHLKQAVLGVSEADLRAAGAVSEPVVLAMAEGAVGRLGMAGVAYGACAITGVAGPSGGSPEKPVGTVWFAWALPHQPTHAARRFFTGDRESIQRQAAWFALSEWCGRLTTGAARPPSTG
jgi:nicotinamide-nucleotide amidase